MIHSTHKLKAYCGDVNRKSLFCEKCGKEEDEGLNDPCTGQFYCKPVDKDKEPK